MMCSLALECALGNQSKFTDLNANSDLFCQFAFGRACRGLAKLDVTARQVEVPVLDVLAKQHAAIPHESAAGDHLDLV